MNLAHDLENLRKDIEELYRKRDYTGVEHRLSEIPRDVLQKDPELTIKLAGALSARYRNPEARQLLHEAKDRVYVAQDELLVRRWQNLYAAQLVIEGDLKEAEEILQSCLSSAERASDQRLIAEVNNSLGIVASHLGEVESALQYYSRALTAWKRRGDTHGVGAAHHNIGLVLREWGRYQEAAAHFLFAEEYYAEMGIRDELVYTAGERALLLLCFGDTEMAEKVARTALAKCEESESSSYIRAGAHKVLGSVLCARGHLAEAREMLHLALELSAKTNSKFLKGEIHEEVAILERIEGDIAAVERNKKAALHYYQSMGSPNQSDRFIKRLLSTDTN